MITDAMLQLAWRQLSWRQLAWRQLAWRQLSWRQLAWRQLAWRQPATLTNNRCPLRQLMLEFSIQVENSASSIQRVIQPEDQSEDYSL